MWMSRCVSTDNMEAGNFDWRSLRNVSTIMWGLMKTAYLTGGTETIGMASSIMPYAASRADTLASDNSDQIDEVERRRLRNASVLLAGCGSISARVAGTLTRLGVERLVLAEPDQYVISPEFDRQGATYEEFVANKAITLADWVLGVRPDARVRVEARGVVAENVAELVSEATLVFDWLTVSTHEAIVAKTALHDEAKRGGVPVISGYDLGGVRMLITYDYRIPDLAALEGRLAELEPYELDARRFLARVVPPRVLPVRPPSTPDGSLDQSRERFPRLVYCPGTIGGVASRLTLDLLAWRAAHRRIIVDVNPPGGPAPRRWWKALARLRALERLSDRTAWPLWDLSTGATGARSRPDERCVPR